MTALGIEKSPLMLLLKLVVDKLHQWDIVILDLVAGTGDTRYPVDTDAVRLCRDLIVMH